jgi:hypothetical protein
VKIAPNTQRNPEISRERSYVRARAASCSESDSGALPGVDLELIHRYLPRLGLYVHSLSSQSIEPLPAVPYCCIPGWHLVDWTLEALQAALNVDQLEVGDIALLLRRRLGIVSRRRDAEHDIGTIGFRRIHQI